MEMRRSAFGVAGVTHETDHVSRLHACSLDRERRVRREVSVVELVPEVVPQPEPVTTELDEADRVNDAVGDREERRAFAGEDVLSVMPAPGDPRSRSAEAVPERGGAEDGEHVAAGREPPRHLG